MNQNTDRDITSFADATQKKLLCAKRWLWCGCGLIGAAIILSIPLCFDFYGTSFGVPAVFCIMLGIMACLIALVIWLTAYLNSKRWIRKNLFPKIAERRFDSGFENGVGFEKDHLKLLNHWIFPSYNEIDYGESFRGIYRGNYLQITEVELTKITIVEEVVEKKDADGNTYTETETREERSCVFNGPVYIMSGFPRKPDKAVSIHSRILPISLGGWKTESIQFNKLFSSQSEDGHSFFKVLSPAFIERILDLDDEVKRYLSMCITPSGLIVLAVNSGGMQLASVSCSRIVKSREGLLHFEELYKARLDAMFRLLSQLDAYGP